MRAIIALVLLATAMPAHADITKSVTLPSGVVLGYHNIQYINIDMDGQTVTATIRSYVNSASSIPEVTRAYTLPFSDIPGVGSSVTRTNLESAIVAKVPLFGGTPDVVAQ